MTGGILHGEILDVLQAAAGNLQSQYQRVGDAIPPPLAMAVLAGLLDAVTPRR